MATDAAGEISELVSKLVSVEAVLNPDAMRKEADGLRDRSADPELWADPDQAQAVTRRLSLSGQRLCLQCGLHFKAVRRTVPRANRAQSPCADRAAKRADDPGCRC